MSAIKCLSCPAAYAPSNINPKHLGYGARAAGWIVWEGLTEGGKHVKRVHCPACQGQQVEEPKPAEPSWDAVCQTCDASMSEDWADEKRPFTEEDCRTWKADHECKKWVEFIAPKRPAMAS